jgi:hypothetical protein
MRLAWAAVISSGTPPGTSSHSTAWSRHATWFLARPRSRCRRDHTLSTAAWSSAVTWRRALASTAATLTDSASSGSFLLLAPVAGSRIRAPSFGWTPRTRSPAATQLRAVSGRRVPPARLRCHTRARAPHRARRAATRPSPATGAIASSTPATSSSVVDQHNQHVRRLPASAEPLPKAGPDDRSHGRHPERSPAQLDRSRPLPGSTKRRRELISKAATPSAEVARQAGKQTRT